MCRVVCQEEANEIKLENPAQIKINHQSGTEPHIVGGNKYYEAAVRAVYQP